VTPAKNNQSNGPTIDIESEWHIVRQCKYEPLTVQWHLKLTQVTGGIHQQRNSKYWLQTTYIVIGNW